MVLTKIDNERAAANLFQPIEHLTVLSAGVVRLRRVAFAGKEFLDHKAERVRAECDIGAAP